MQITVIGAANVDIFTKSGEKIIHGDSNPATVKTAAGGVARNIAENLSRLGASVNFITAVGDDAFGRSLREQCDGCGMDTDAWVVRAGMSTGVYLAALDSDGELYAAFNAMSVLETLAAEDFSARGECIKQSELLVLDANLTEAALAAVLDSSGGVPVMADTVSVAKAPRLLRLLNKIDTLKTNRAEAAALTGYDLNTEDEIRRACETLLAYGPARVFVTLGADGVCAADRHGVLRIPATPVDVKNVTGAGDAFSAGVALYHGRSLADQARFGMACAALTLAADNAVSTDMTQRDAEAFMKNIKENK